MKNPCSRGHRWKTMDGCRMCKTCELRSVLLGPSCGAYRFWMNEHELRDEGVKWRLGAWKEFKELKRKVGA